MHTRKRTHTHRHMHAHTHAKNTHTQTHTLAHTHTHIHIQRRIRMRMRAIQQCVMCTWFRARRTAPRRAAPGLDRALAARGGFATGPLARGGAGGRMPAEHTWHACRHADAHVWPFPTALVVLGERG